MMKNAYETDINEHLTYRFKYEDIDKLTEK